MKGLRKKLNSQRGASIVLALLFLLVCMMVAASILMAAVSNAGKIRSNKEEQQKYLTLSSALQLVCDELEAAKYQGVYEYSYTPAETDADGKIIAPAERAYTQGDGTWTEGGMCTVLPLNNSLDAIFAGNFRLASSDEEADDKYIYDAKTIAPFPEKYTLTLDVLMEEEKTAHPELETLWGQVTITVTIKKDTGYLYLNAKMGDYSMEAELIPKPDLSTALVLEVCSTSGTYTTDSVKWELSKIGKKVGTGG